MFEKVFSSLTIRPTLQFDHLEEQVHLLDVRQLRVVPTPVAKFGHKENETKKHVRSVHRKGDLLPGFFVRGYQDGSVLIWDFRNTNVGPCDFARLTRLTTLQRPVEELRARGDTPVMQTLFAGDEPGDVWAYHTGLVSFLPVAR